MSKHQHDIVGHETHEAGTVRGVKYCRDCDESWHYSAEAGRYLNSKNLHYDNECRVLFRQNENAYWNAHIEFGTDENLRTKWFFEVGFDSGYDYAVKQLGQYKTIEEALENLNRKEWK